MNTQRLKRARAGIDLVLAAAAQSAAHDFGKLSGAGDGCFFTLADDGTRDTAGGTFFAVSINNMREFFLAGALLLCAAGATLLVRVAPGTAEGSAPATPGRH